MSTQATPRRALSWPGPPYANPCIDELTELFERLGFEVQGATPVAWQAGFRKADLFIVHWPDAVFWGKPVRWRHLLRQWLTLANFALLRARGVRIVWFAHNLSPHDLDAERRAEWDRYFGRFRRRIHGWLTLAPSTGELVIEAHPSLADIPHGFLWHPPYATEHTPDRNETRAALGLHDASILFSHVGMLRAYKKLGPWVTCFQQHRPDDARLLLAGKSLRGEGERLSAQASESVQVMLGALEAERFRGLLAATDVFLAPYDRFLHSGALVHALSQGCVCVAPSTPFTRDLAEAVGAEWLLFCDAEPTAEILDAAAERARALVGQRPNLEPLGAGPNLERLTAFIDALSVRNNAGNHRS